MSALKDGRPDCISRRSPSAVIPSPSAFIRQFTGDNRFIVDFLAEEVLSRQPSDIRQFLARTAVLDRFCAPLCDTVTGSGNAADVIDVLERENLFVVPLDDNRQWYRYHHLFAQVLRGQLARTEPGIGPILYERASAWHQEYGSTDEAIGYALAAGDVAWAVDLIASRWFGFVDSGRVATVRGWLRSLGDNQIAAHRIGSAQRSVGRRLVRRAGVRAALASDHPGRQSMTVLFLTACGRWTSPPQRSAAPSDSTASGRCENQRPGPSS